MKLRERRIRQRGLFRCVRLKKILDEMGSEEKINQEIDACHNKFVDVRCEMFEAVERENREIEKYLFISQAIDIALERFGGFERNDEQKVELVDLASDSDVVLSLK